jgi:hypothetical protein
MRPLPTISGDGDISKQPGCQFTINEPAMLRRAKKVGLKPPSTQVASVIPENTGCIVGSVVTSVGCAGAVACSFFTFGICMGGAMGACAAAGATVANCVQTRHPSCFPADAHVQLPDGSAKRMDQLVIGDKVKTMSPAGLAAYSDVYLFGHDDANSYAPFVELSLSTNKLLLSDGHYIPTASGPACSINNPAACSQLMKRASDVQLGDLVWSMNATSGQFALDSVQAIGEEFRRGLYNPFTLSGDLVVNGVLVSAHSDWFLDRVMPQGYVSNIPAVYQTIMSPMRAVYAVGGANAVKYLDTNLKVVEIASKMSL